jgi:hypothetical protein
MELAKMLNYFVPKGGVSNFYSPRMIVTKDNLNYDKHCLIPFRYHVQAGHEATFKNDNHPRTLDCLYLRYINNDQGGHELLDLRTGKTICRQMVTKVPITTSIIKLGVHAIAAQDGMQMGLKLQNRSGKVIYESSWIKGVDYDDDDDADDDDESYDEEEDDVSEDDVSDDVTETTAEIWMSSHYLSARGL